MIGLCATLKAQSGKEKELETILRGMVENAKRETGTWHYILHTADDDPRTFFFYEQYVDSAALDFHGSTDYFRREFGKAEELLSEPATIATFKVLTAK